MKMKLVFTFILVVSSISVGFAADIASGVDQNLNYGGVSPGILQRLNLPNTSNSTSIGGNVLINIPDSPLLIAPKTTTFSRDFFGASLGDGSQYGNLSNYFLSSFKSTLSEPQSEIVVSSPLCCTGALCNSTEIAQKCSDIISDDIGSSNRQDLSPIITRLIGQYGNNTMPDDRSLIAGTRDFCRKCLSPSQSALDQSEASLGSELLEHTIHRLEHELEDYQSLAANILLNYRAGIEPFIERLINNTQEIQARPEGEPLLLIDSFRNKFISDATTYTKVDGGNLRDFIEKRLGCRDISLEARAAELELNKAENCSNAPAKLEQIETAILHPAGKLPGYITEPAGEDLTASLFAVHLASLSDSDFHQLKVLCKDKREESDFKKQYFSFFNGLVQAASKKIFSPSDKALDELSTVEALLLQRQRKDNVALDIVDNPNFLCDTFESSSAINSESTADEIERVLEIENRKFREERNSSIQLVSFEELLYKAEVACGRVFKEKTEWALCGERNLDDFPGKINNSVLPEKLHKNSIIAANVRSCESQHLVTGNPGVETTADILALKDEVDRRGGLVTNASNAQEKIKKGVIETGRLTNRSPQEVAEVAGLVSTRRGGAALATRGSLDNILGRTTSSESGVASATGARTSTAARSPASTSSSENSNRESRGSIFDVLNNQNNNLNGSLNSQINNYRAPVSPTRVAEEFQKPENRDLVDDFNRIANDVSDNAAVGFDATSGVRDLLSAQNVEFPESAGIDPDESARLRDEINRLREDINRRAEGESAEAAVQRRIAAVEESSSERERKLEEIIASLRSGKQSVERAPQVAADASNVGINSGTSGLLTAAQIARASSGSDGVDSNGNRIEGVTRYNSSGQQIMSDDVIAALATNGGSVGIRYKDSRLFIQSGETFTPTEAVINEVGSDSNIVSIRLGRSVVPFSSLAQDSQAALLEYFNTSDSVYSATLKAKLEVREISRDIASVAGPNSEVGSRLSELQRAYQEALTSGVQIINDRSN